MVAVISLIRTLLLSRGCFARFGLVDEFTLDLDPADIQETSFQACAVLSRLGARFVGEWFCPDVADSEACEDLLPGFLGFNAFAYQLFSVNANYIAVDEALFNGLFAAA